MEMQETLLKLENAFLKVAFSSDRNCLNRHVHTDFIEYGSSGTCYQKQELIDYLLAQTEDRPIKIIDVTCKALTDDSWQVNYKTKQDSRLVPRESTWFLESGRLQIKQHQAFSTNTK